MKDRIRITTIGLSVCLILIFPICINGVAKQIGNAKINDSSPVIHREPKYINVEVPVKGYQIRLDAPIIMEGELLDGILFNLPMDEATTVTLVLETGIYEFVMTGKGIINAYLNTKDLKLTIIDNYEPRIPNGTIIEIEADNNDTTR